MRMQELAEEMKSYTESRQDGGGLLCQICASTPCRCALRRVEERLVSLYTEKRMGEEMNTKEENGTFRSVSYDKKLTSCQEQTGTRNRKRKLSKEDLTGMNKASKIEPQHHPIAHQGDDGEGMHQQPHHQREGDGGAAGIVDKIGKKVTWMGQQLHQPPANVGVDGDVDRWKLKANPAQPDAKFNKEEVPNIKNIRKMFQEMAKPSMGCSKVKSTSNLKTLDHDTTPYNDCPPINLTSNPHLDS